MNRREPTLIWTSTGLLALMLLGLALWGEPAARVLEYDRADILEGELWRIVTAHFIHAGPAHLLLNLAGLALVSALFGRLFGPRFWIFSLTACMVGVSTGQLLLCPELQWYRGFSGVLHGLLVLGLVGAAAQHRRAACSGLVLLCGKLVAELPEGAGAASRLVLDAPVIPEAHLFGAVAGGLMAGLYGFFKARDADRLALK